MTKRTARRNFKQQYGETTYEVVSRIARGESVHSIAESVGSSMRSVATTKGNLTRGWYAPWVYQGATGAVRGICQF